MRRILSTYIYRDQPLTSSLLASIKRAGIDGVEVFCGIPHFNYRVPESVRELANLLGEYQLKLHGLHAPIERNFLEGRESGIPMSIADPERIRRTDAVDEVKRALDVAEMIPFRYFSQHLATGRQDADARKFDAAFSSLEHLILFAKQRGVTIALQNSANELGSPASLHQFAKETRLDLRYCFDIGHAHIDSEVVPSFELLRDRVVTTHIHDNHGERDEHLLPYEGTIDWDAALAAFSRAPEPLPLVLELKEQSPGVPSLDQIRAAFDKLEKHLDEKGVSPARA
jgi:sugar phosphate isomerase/epimerase